jgi:hypothetical protein
LTWLARILFHGTLAAALFLGGLVLLAPSLDQQGGDLWPRIVVTFAQDSVVRRIALVGAAGLFVTAVVFFRPALVRAKAARARLRKSDVNNFAGA